MKRTVTVAMLSCIFADAEPEKVQDELHQLERYLHDALGIDVTTTPWRGRERLPHFLKELYGFAETDLLGIPCLLTVDTSPTEQSPAALRKHIDLLRTKQNAEVIYVRASVTAYNRKRLIEHKVPFIVPGNQMYLPMLAIDLREHFRRLRAESPTFSPSTQAVVIHALLRGADEVFIPLEMAQRLGYSAMTMTRAFDELESANLGEVTVSGRERCLRFTGSRQEIWAKAQPFLRSPVSKRLFVRQTKNGMGSIRAGLTALAQYSMLAPPAYTTYALSREDWKLLRQRNTAIQVPNQEPDAHEIEVWSYLQGVTIFCLPGPASALDVLVKKAASRWTRTRQKGEAIEQSGKLWGYATSDRPRAAMLRRLTDINAFSTVAVVL